jgi:AraC-like DNA-binding protein
LAEIEPNIDLFAFLILFGVIQGFILSLFFLNKKNRLNQPNIFIGLLMLTFSLLSLDIFLCYTGYMSHVIYLDNFSESLSLVFGPLFYLYVISSIKGKLKNSLWLHFLPFILYTAYNVLYFIQPADFKYVSYINAYFPEQNPDIVSPIVNPDPLHLRKYLDVLIMVQNASYYLLAIISVINSFKKENVSIFVRRYKNLSWLRNFSMAYFCLFAVFIAVTLLFGDDIGDYLISSFMALIIYGTSVNVIRSSGFFTEHLNIAVTAGRKYARSSLSEEDKMEILKKLRDGMEVDKYYRSNLLSQSQMSKKLLIPVHHISQVINEKLNQSFFEFMAAYRIKEAENLLLDPDNNHLTVEEIAEEVGYISKSAFNKTFKKITGKTPSEYRTVQ